MTLGQKQELFAKYVVKLIQQAWEMGYEVRLGEVQRPLEMQQIYVNTGRSKTLDSQHIKKLAIDLVLLKGGAICTRDQIAPLGKWWENLDSQNRWGGSWRGLIEAKKSSFVDAPHFEMQG
jgi:peptidoglycan L-alanyl-D-glutamate endopeptidase CwlK